MYTFVLKVYLVGSSVFIFLVLAINADPSNLRMFPIDHTITTASIETGIGSPPSYIVPKDNQCK
jgi:hypothetical protein